MIGAVRAVPMGDAAVVIEVDEGMTGPTSHHPVALAAALMESRVNGVRDIVPGLRSVTVHFDPLRTRYEELLEWVAGVAALPTVVADECASILELPVCYGGDLGPDLDYVAERCGLSADDVVACHASRTYRVLMLGFVPGFAYLGPLDTRIAIPRREAPRTRVPAGSVAVADDLTGVYPCDTPGGWHIIGRTSVQLFDASLASPALLAPGDRVRFRAINRRGFDRTLSSRGVGER